LTTRLDCAIVALVMESRQRKWQKKMKDQKRCRVCGKPTYKAGRCVRHYVIHLESVNRNAKKKRG